MSVSPDPREHVFSNDSAFEPIMGIDYPEWFMSNTAQAKMLELFPDMLSEEAKRLFAEGKKLKMIGEMEALASTMRKCRELNSIECLVTPNYAIGQSSKTTFYFVGDVVFTTVPGRFPGQKFVSGLSSLKMRRQRTKDIEDSKAKKKKSTRVMNRVRRERNEKRFWMESE